MTQKIWRLAANAAWRFSMAYQAKCGRAVISMAKEVTYGNQKYDARV